MEQKMQNRPIIIGVSWWLCGGKTSVSKVWLILPNEKIAKDIRLNKATLIDLEWADQDQLWPSFAFDTIWWLRTNELLRVVR